jgi:hypothetical protein
VIKEDTPGAKRPSYSIVYNPEDISGMFSDIELKEENGHFYIAGKFRGSKVVHERLLPKI